jgi:hypothetical protein
MLLRAEALADMAREKRMAASELCDRSEVVWPEPLARVATGLALARICCSQGWLCQPAAAVHGGGHRRRACSRRSVVPAGRAVSVLVRPRQRSSTASAAGCAIAAVTGGAAAGTVDNVCMRE